MIEGFKPPPPNTKRFNTWRHEQGVDGCLNCKANEHSHIWRCQCGRELAWQDELLPIACECGGQRASLFCPTNQSRVSAWVRSVFTEKEATDVPERALRMAEEALELAQACEVDAATLHRLVDYVMSRPVGKPAQEIAGTMVTLYAMAGALGVDADTAFEVELERIQQPEVIERCQRRQHEKRAALVAATDEIERYGIRITHEAWFTVDGGPDLIGTKDQMEAVAKLEKLNTSGDEKFVYKPTPYTGSDPATQATVKEFLARTANLYYLEDDEFCDDGKTGALR